MTSDTPDVLRDDTTFPKLKYKLDDDTERTVRSRATEILENLERTLTIIDTTTTTTNHENENSSNNHEIVYDSWINGRRPIGSDTDHRQQYPSERCQFFDVYGFLLIKSFADVSTEVEDMKLQMRELANDRWDPNDGNNGKGGGEKKKKLTVFRTDEKQINEQGSDDYFLESADQVHFFTESGAMDDDGNLKDEFLKDGNEMRALNKVGHGMHLIPGAFRDYATSGKVSDLVRDLGWVDPVVPQSMYIFKQARVGGEVTSHQDSTFLYTSPRQSCLGMWLALDDATIGNGCLWVRPGSHREGLRRRFVRNPEHFGESCIRSRSNVAKGDISKSQMIFLDENEDDGDGKDVTWEGKIPDMYDCPWKSLFESGFVPVECKAGDLVVFPGQLDHLSLPNYSNKQRHTFQLHLVEGEKAGVTWSETNWLQYPRRKAFLNI